VYENYRKDEQDKLGEELEAGDPVLLRRLGLNPWTNNHKTEYTYNALDSKEYEEPKENVIKLSHL
jgi:hypothetical protein